MPRILGVDIPNNKKVPYSLAALFGIGLHRAVHVCAETGIDVHRRAYQLTEEELGAIATYIESNYVIEGNLRREIQANVARVPTRVPARARRRPSPTRRFCANNLR